MSSDLIKRLRDHVAARGGPTVENGCWGMMLEAADRLEAYEAATVAIHGEISALVDQDLELRFANQEDAATADRLRAQIADRRKRRQQIHIKIRGLTQALGEIRAALPLSTRHNDPVFVDAIIDDPEKDPDEVPVEGDVGDEWFRESAAHQETQDAAAQPGGAGGTSITSEDHPEGEPLPTEVKIPATA